MLAPLRFDHLSGVLLDVDCDAVLLPSSVCESFTGSVALVSRTADHCSAVSAIGTTLPSVGRPNVSDSRTDVPVASAERAVLGVGGSGPRGEASASAGVGSGRLIGSGAGVGTISGIPSSNAGKSSCVSIIIGPSAVLCRYNPRLTTLGCVYP